jgi:two-component system response regulator RpaA
MSAASTLAPSLVKKTVFTTGQVAKICQVASRTVSKWFDSGRLKGYRMPDSGDRRIPRQNLIDFLREHQIPLGDLDDTPRLLLIGIDSLISHRIQQAVPADQVQYQFAANGFEAGLIFPTLRPQAIVIDLLIGRNEALSLVQTLRSASKRRTLYFGLANEDQSDHQDLLDAGFTDIFQKPFDVGIMAQSVRKHLTAA